MGNAITVEIEPGYIAPDLESLPTGYTNPLETPQSNNDPDPPSTVINTDRYVSIVRYQRAATKPANPITSWWNTGTQQVEDTGAWKDSKSAADTAGDTANPLWIAYDAVSIQGNPGAYALLYNGWSVHQFFDVEYSADGTTWRTTQETGDRYFGFRTESGVRKVIEIAAPQDLDWTGFLNSTSPYAGGSQGARHISLGSAVNFTLFNRIRFYFRPFGQFQSGGTGIDHIGAEMNAILYKPSSGWIVDTDSDDDHNDSVFLWSFDDRSGAFVIYQHDYSGNDISLPSAQGRPTANDPPHRVSGYGKFVGLSASAVTHIRLFGWAANSSFKRFQLKLYGATY